MNVHLKLIIANATVDTPGNGPHFVLFGEMGQAITFRLFPKCETCCIKSSHAHAMQSNQAFNREPLSINTGPCVHVTAFGVLLCARFETRCF